MKLVGDFKPTREGDVLLLTVPNYWGKGDTLEEAKANLKKAGGKIGKYWRLRSVAPDTYVSEIGNLVYPVDHTPILLVESNPN